MVSTDFDTGSRVSIGGIGGEIAEFARWPPWHDRAVLVRSFPR